MDFLPVKKKRIYQEIIEQLKQKIEEGEICYGEKLPSERMLADKLSVSRTSVKEAFSVLESAGVVEIRQGSGVYLRKNSHEDMISRINAIIHGVAVDIVELMEFRLALERDAAYYAAERGSAEEMESIYAAFRNLESAVEKNNIAAEEDLAFHMTIARAAGNSVTERVMLMLSDQIREGLIESRARTLKIPDQSRIVLEEHRAIYEAIKNGNAIEARRAMDRHLEAVKQRYL
ncbi:FadR/GntR family transcriptional regulator [Virgibacillus kekensis]|uniref:FadR/GntR family transcriptional regulator n=1 Tax=Virgibacillus kekensis TaxID=202261 RepID=A0ABV9DJ00_9BACI